MTYLSELERFEEIISKAYKGRNRSKLWLSACLMQEAGELAELIIKKVGYSKAYGTCDVASEAGDVLNFLTAILQAHGLTLEDAMISNYNKLVNRGWLDEIN